MFLVLISIFAFAAFALLRDDWLLRRAAKPLLSAEPQPLAFRLPTRRTAA